MARRSPLVAIAVAAALLSIAIHPSAEAPSPDPFAFFKPTVVLSASDRRLLERGEPLTRVIPSQDREVAVFAAVKTRIDGDRLLAWIHRIELLKKSSYVLAIGRMSSTPQLADLKGLALDEDEASDVLDCRPGDCSMKLSATEMEVLRQAAAGARDGSSTAAVQAAFQATVLRRIQEYLAGGLRALPLDDSGSDPISPVTTLDALLNHSRFLSTNAPDLVRYLANFPRVPLDGVDSFVYWSKEQIAGKPIVSATHVSTMRGSQPGAPEALSATIGIFSTHYVSASLGVMAIMREGPGAPGYLVYVNRSRVDVLGGFFGGLVRMIVQRRLRTEAVDVLRGVRKRLESGDPPAQATDGGTQR